MKAILSRTAGGPETLTFEELPDPSPSKGEVLIRVRAIGVNYPDTLIIEDRYQFRPERPFSPGAEAAGIVEALGEGVTSLAVGDRVLVMLGWGGMAQKVVADAADCFVLPGAMPFDEAAAFLMTYGTSYYALKDRANLAAGETLLVLGAAGGVGLAAVELGHAMGATVVAAASTQSKVDLAVSRGARTGLTYPSGPLDTAARKSLSASLKEALSPHGAHIIYDPVGGDYAEAALRAIAWEGRYLVVGFPAGIPNLPLNLVLLKSCDVRGVFWGAAIKRDPARHREAVDELFDLYAQGAIRPTISQRYSLENSAAAIAALTTRRSTGKIVVTVD